MIVLLEELYEISYCEDSKIAEGFINSTMTILNSNIRIIGLLPIL